jgi:anti-sigma factor RsiW
MNCTHSQQLIECYADGELDAVTSASVETHLEYCAACQRMLERLSSLRVLVKEAIPCQAAPESLANRIRSSVKSVDSPPARSSPRWWEWLKPAALVAATAAVTWVATLQFTQSSQKQVLAQEVISSHARAAITGHLADIDSSERHTVKPWLSSKLDFSPPVPDLASAGFPLTGGRLDYIGRRPVAVLIYQRRKHVIDLFVWPEREAHTATTETLSQQGYQIVNWNERGMSFWAVSDLNAAELKTFALTYSSAK